MPVVVAGRGALAAAEGALAVAPGALVAVGSGRSVGAADADEARVATLPERTDKGPRVARTNMNAPRVPSDARLAATISATFTAVARLPRAG